MKCNFMQGVEFSHWLLKRFLPEDAFVIDATAGRGNDTKFLARLLNENAQIWAFDIQKKALKFTHNNLKKKELLTPKIHLIHDGHENIENYIDVQINGAIFNLGYLPGENREVITRPNTTLKAVKSCLSLLQKGGLIVIVIYTGHPSGEEEKNTIIDFTSDLDCSRNNVLHYHFINQEKPPAEVVAIRKRR